MAYKKHVYTTRFYDNTEFLTNCVDYLCDNMDLIELRSKVFHIGLLNQSKVADKQVRQRHQALTIGLPLALLALLGGIVTIVRRKMYAV